MKNKFPIIWILNPLLIIINFKFYSGNNLNVQKKYMHPLNIKEIKY